jgi:hypothetical protein
MRALIVTGLVVLLLWFSTPAASGTFAVAPAPLACGAAGTPAAMTTAPIAEAVAAAAPPPPVVLQTIVDVPLPGSASRFDYQSLDEASGRLVIAHMGADQVVVFDTITQQIVGTVGDVKTPTGVLAVPELGRIFAAAGGSGDVAVIDAERLAAIAHVGQTGFPDGLDYVPAVKQVFVSDESGSGELVIDATSTDVVTTIAIGGEAGNTHHDPGSICVLVAVDPRTHRVYLPLENVDGKPVLRILETADAS